MTLAKFLRAERERRSVTQRSAAEAVGVHSLTWTGWERGRIPALKHLFAIADWAGCTVDDLRPYLEELR